MSARGVNKVILIGNTGGQPEVRSTNGGTRVANVSLATSSQWTDRSGQKQERTEWHRLVFWSKLAEIVEKYVGKGDKLYVEGELRTNSWEGDDGQTRYRTEIHVQNMTMLGSPRGRQSSPDQSRQSQSADQPVPAGGGEAETDDDLFEEGQDDLPF